jgi:hypothetical protein
MVVSVILITASPGPAVGGKHKGKGMLDCNNKIITDYSYVPGIGIGFDTISIVSFAIKTAAFIIFPEEMR